jgi:hypothetical protein
MADDFYGYDDEGDEPKGRDNLFLWTVFILLLVGLAFACWLGSFYVFGHPEKPASYKFLKKIGKIENQVRFEVTDAPQGEFLTAQKLFERYGRMTPLELADENAKLMRAYIKNYRESKTLVPYVIGRYVICDSHTLTKSDLFPSGVVALAQAAEFPQVVIEHVYTIAPRHIPSSLPLLQTGREMKIERTDDLAALLNVERLTDGHMQFTVVPLLYPRYAVTQGAGTLNLEPPTELNMEAGLPVIKKEAFAAGLKKFADYRRTHPLPSASNPAANNTTPPPAPELVRVDSVPPGGTVPMVGELPPVPVATPIAIPGKATPRIAGATPKPGAATPRVASVTPVPATPVSVAMLNTPGPRAVTPLPMAVTPLPMSATPAQVSPSGVPLQPFIKAERNPNMPAAGGSWRVYAPGKAPPARTITASEAGTLADRDLNERVYLRGNFRVSATGENRAILREQNEDPNTKGARIIVDYPAGAVPPAEKATFTRDTNIPYEIRSVRRLEDGQLNIFVVEIMQQ